ncbi:MAG: hypothetical protein GX334_08515 [Firmicutes bacterium]|nr:hypothetical protein [Bacillota bacterium]
MYPLTHIYFARKALGFLDDAVVLGSVFPDIIVVTGLDWKLSHTRGLKFWQRCSQQGNKALRNFSLGVITHGIEPKGLDYYSDKQYKDFEKGYCFEKARPLVNSVVKACRLPADDGWWKAHNFIEMGVELYIYEKQPELLALLRQAHANTALIRQLVCTFSPLLGKSKLSLQKAFAVFRAAAEEPFALRRMVLRFQRQVVHRYNVASIDLPACKEIILRGKKLIVPDIEAFFLNVKKMMSPVWKEIWDEG